MIWKDGAQESGDRRWTFSVEVRLPTADPRHLLD